MNYKQLRTKMVSGSIVIYQKLGGRTSLIMAG